jgi:hypothetical protein
VKAGRMRHAQVAHNGALVDDIHDAAAARLVGSPGETAWRTMKAMTNKRASCQRLHLEPPTSTHECQCRAALGVL